MFRFTTSVTVSALTAAAEEDVTISEPRVRVGDVIVANTLAAPETGLVILAAWVDAVGSIKLRLGNVNASDALTGGATDFRICVLR